jgi:hypothetical protein
MRIKRAFLVAVVGPLLAAMPVFAHHSFGAQYDQGQSVTLSGTITKVIWKNPHVQLNLDVKDDAGNVKSWDLEMGSPSILLKQGWKVDSLKPGDQVTVTGFRAKDGSPAMNARKVILANR